MTEQENALRKAKAAWQEAQKRWAELKPQVAKAKDDLRELKRAYEDLHQQVHAPKPNSNLRYFLQLNHLGPSTVLPLEPAEFEAIALARHRLSAALGLEENFELLMRNYMDWESELDSIAKTEISFLEEPLANFELRERPNRRLVNVLTAALMCVDHAKQLLKQITDHPETAQCAFEEHLGAHYDRVLPYRFFAALRNYVQHNGLAVHKLSLGFSRESPDNTVEAFTLLRHLEEGDSFTPRSLLKQLPSEVDLRDWLKQYLHCLAKSHHYVRAVVKPNVDAAAELLRRHTTAYAALNDGETFALAAIETSEAGRGRVVFLHLQWDVVREHLTARAPDGSIRQ